MVDSIDGSHLFGEDVPLSFVRAVGVLVVESADTTDAKSGDGELQASRITGLLGTKASDETPDLFDGSVDVSYDLDIGDQLLISHGAAIQTNQYVSNFHRRRPSCTFKFSVDEWTWQVW